MPCPIVQSNHVVNNVGKVEAVLLAASVSFLNSSRNSDRVLVKSNNAVLEAYYS